MVQNNIPESLKLSTLAGQLFVKRKIKVFAVIAVKEMPSKHHYAQKIS